MPKRQEINVSASMSSSDVGLGLISIRESRRNKERCGVEKSYHNVAAFPSDRHISDHRPHVVKLMLNSHRSTEVLKLVYLVYTFLS